MLNPLDAKKSRNHFSNLGKFSFVGAKGSTLGRSGAGVRLMQGVLASSVHAAAILEEEGSDEAGFSEDPDSDDLGKSCGSKPSSPNAVSDRYKPRVFFYMCTIWRVTSPPTSMRSSAAPAMSSSESVIPTIR